MRYLLDTHVFLWLQTSPQRVGDDVLTELADEDHELLLSAASSWEIAIKHATGRLALPEAPATYVPSRARAIGARLVVVEHGHALAVAELPPLHRDPFDRLLVVQAAALDAVLVTADEQVTAYGGAHRLVG